jgi:hypothetical protein
MSARAVRLAKAEPGYPVFDHDLVARMAAGPVGSGHSRLDKGHNYPASDSCSRLTVDDHATRDPLKYVT